MTATICTKCRLRRTPHAIMLLYILLVGFYQLKMSISLEKRVILAASNHVDAAPQFPTQNATIPTGFNPINSTRGMSACILVMDDTIKLTEWLAYHYTVLPLSHLIVAIDPASVLENEINRVLSLWNTRMYIEVWTNDTWMTLPPDKGWPPSAYFPNKKLNRKRIARKHSLQHKRRQEHFAIECMRRIKRIHPSWVLHLDTDEFLTFNYIHPDEDESFFLSNSTEYQRKVKSIRNNRMPLRRKLPKPLGRITISEFLNRALVKPCIKIPGLQMSAQEQLHVSMIYNHTPPGIDPKTLMTLRHFHHGNKYGRFTKTLLNLKRIPQKAIRQEFVRTIHNPMGQVCGRHNEQYIGIDYISSILRLHHYAGTRESFEQRQFDARNRSYDKRNVSSLGENFDLQPWIHAFVKKVGMEEAQRLLEPLQAAYRYTDWSSVWRE